MNCFDGVNKLQIGKSLTKGLGTGGDSEIGEKAVEENSNDISSIIKDAETIITVACLGGGTGNGATPVVLNKISKETNAKNLAIVTLPFSFEGNRRMNKAQEALSKIKKSADNTIVFENDKILETLDKRITLGEAFSDADKIISDLIFEELKK